MTNCLPFDEALVHLFVATDFELIKAIMKSKRCDRFDTKYFNYIPVDYDIAADFELGSFGANKVTDGDTMLINNIACNNLLWVEATNRDDYWQINISVVHYYDQVNWSRNEDGHIKRIAVLARIVPLQIHRCIDGSQVRDQQLIIDICQSSDPYFIISDDCNCPIAYFPAWRFVSFETSWIFGPAPKWLARRHHRYPIELRRIMFTLMLVFNRFELPMDILFDSLFTLVVADYHQLWGERAGLQTLLEMESNGHLKTRI